MGFPISKSEIWQRLQGINAKNYGFSRNYVDGAVTKLSPYISRGVLSTRIVFEHLKKSNFTWEQSEKLIQELAWRDFFQHVWKQIGEDINQDIKNIQTEVRSKNMCQGILTSTTGISAIDQGVEELYSTGYMHNHLRMYIASLTCNLSRCHWQTPAKWMCYHLLDADWASNACSWQWVAGAFSNKKYWANQENINKFGPTQDTKTYLYVSYDALPQIEIPEALFETQAIGLSTVLPANSEQLHINPNIKTLLYNWYNLDFQWHPEDACNRILLLEPSIFEKYPISEKSLDFMLGLSKNIPDVQIFVGEFNQLKELLEDSVIVFKEHPLNQYHGIEEPRDWLCAAPAKQYMSFFGFWKAIQNELRAYFETK